MITNRKLVPRRTYFYAKIHESERMLRNLRRRIRISETKKGLSKHRTDIQNYNSIAWKLNYSIIMRHLFLIGATLSLFLCVAEGQRQLPFQIGTMMRAQSGRVQRVVVEQIRNISEGITPGPYAVLATYQAYDKMPGDLAGTNWTFRINRTTDQDRQFFIGPKDGILKVAKPLDREKIPQYRLVIEAVDEAGNVGHTILVVNLEDVNDNAPELNVTRIPVIPENIPAPLFVATVTAFDRDSPENGPPFFMEAPPNSSFLDQFTFTKLPNADGGNGAINISTRIAFDREQHGKTLQLPIYVRDSGKPPMDAIRYFPVIIGDENDNPMTDGRSVIQVYNYNNQMPATAIGRAYVKDLDDWDISDKRFTWKNKGPDGFTLSQDGIITIDPQSYSLGPEYSLEIAVEDTKRNEYATAYVKVLIEIITETAFNNAGSIRIKNIEAEDFIRIFEGDSQYNKLRKFLSEKIGVSASSVAIFSVMSQGDHPPIIQVFFAVRGSPYKSPTYLNGLLLQNRDELEQMLGRGAQVIQINVDDCIFESCEYGCVRVATPDIKPTVWNSNETSLVGVTTTVKADCMRCAVPIVPRACSPNPCKNGGLCHEANPGVFCECRGDFHGPFCEGRLRTFTADSSYAWLDPIRPCTKLHLRFEFMTTQSNALLLYDGPMTTTRPGDYGSTDFIAVEILDSKPALLLNLGHGSIFAKMNLAPNVNDGDWHRIDVILNAQDFILMLDECRNSNGLITSTNGTLNDCQVIGNVPNDYEQLNVVDPLQIGGLAMFTNAGYPSLNTTNSMDGCIRNVYVNHVLQDLGSPPNAVQSSAGCASTNKICMAGSDPICVNGLCVSSMNDNGAKCVCDPGYAGEKCDQTAVWRNFDPSSYVSYNFLDTMILSPNAMSLRMIFVPRKQDGVLFRGTSVAGNAYVQMEMDGFQVAYRNNMGQNIGFQNQYQQDDRMLQLIPRLNTTQAYYVEFERDLVYLKMTLDGMPDPLTVTNYEKNTPLDFDRKRFFAGAQSDSSAPSADFQGCIAQILYDDKPIPVSQSDDQKFAMVTGQKAISDGCPDLATCGTAGIGCPPNYVCKDFWKGPFCTCSADKKPLFDSDGVWINCGEPTAALKLGITNGAVAAILICLLVLLVLVLLLVVYSRRRRIIPPPSPYSDVRENIINYAEEGGGEADQDRYNIAPLRKPVLPIDDFRQPQGPGIGNGRPTTPPDGNMADLIRDRVRLADTDPTAPPYDELRAYADEDAMSVGSLSSLSSDEDEGVEWDALNTWGPRFRKLAELYGSQD